jgi:hypothetical protein
MEPRSPEYETGEPRGHSVHSAAYPTKSFSIVTTTNRSEFLNPQALPRISMNTLIYGTPRMKHTDLQRWSIVSSVHRLESEWLSLQGHLFYLHEKNINAIPRRS